MEYNLPKRQRDLKTFPKTRGHLNFFEVSNILDLCRNVRSFFNSKDMKVF